MKRKWAWALLPTGGILMALCLVFPSLATLQWFAMTPALLFLFARTEGERPARFGALYGAGVLYYLSFYLVIFHWFFYLYPMEFAGVTPNEAAVLVLICWLGLSLLQTVFSSLVFPLYGLLSRTTLARRAPFLLPLLFAAQYAVAEWSQTLTWLGVPWARLPLGQLECGFLLNGASFFGSYLLTFSLVAVSALTAFAILHLDRVRFAAATALSLIVFNVLAGAVGYAAACPTAGEPIVVAAIQGNVGSSQKWTSAETQRTKEVYWRLTAKAVEEGATLVVFPETFLPHTLTESSGAGKFVKELATTYNVTVMCGAFHYDRESDKTQNAVFTVYPDGTVDEVVYAKRHLVPFGEYVPLRSVIEVLVPPLANIGMLSEDLQAGTDAAIVETPFGSVGALICFDSIYEELTRDSVREGAQLLVLPTNDSWFTDSAGVYMHSGQARLRAIESGRWIVRAADTGISSVISPTGKTHGEQPPLVEGYALSTACVRTARTPYSYIGNLFVYLLIAAILTLPAAEVYFAVKKRKGEGE